MDEILNVKCKEFNWLDSKDWLCELPKNCKHVDDYWIDDVFKDERYDDTKYALLDKICKSRPTIRPNLNNSFTISRNNNINNSFTITKKCNNNTNNNNNNNNNYNSNNTNNITYHNNDLNNNDDIDDDQSMKTRTFTRQRTKRESLFNGLACARKPTFRVRPNSSGINGQHTTDRRSLAGAIPRINERKIPTLNGQQSDQRSIARAIPKINQDWKRGCY